MKSFVKISAILLAAAFTASSCSRFLDEKITTSYDGDIVENADSEEALEANIAGCYKQFAASGFKTGTFNEWLAPGSGLLIYGSTSALTNPLERWTCALKFTRFSRHPEAYESFTSFYRAIYRCNSLLKVLETSPVDESYKNEIAGEAYFIRAASYFWLVRLYGDVSLNLTVPESGDELYSVRADFWDVYCRIVKDLDKAWTMMRDFPRMVAVAGGNGSGRVCNYGAKAMRSLVYLTIGTLLAHPDDNFWLAENRTPDFSEIGITSAGSAFELALADAVDVIDNGPFELCPDYRQLWRWTKPQDWQLRERIFVLPRTSVAKDGGSALTQWALPNGYNGTQEVPNYGRCRPDRWLFQKWCERYNGEDREVLAGSRIYVGCADPRLSATMIHTSFINYKNVDTPCYPASGGVQTTDLKGKGIPYCKKYYDPTFDNSTGNSDFYVMRFAEVYLIAAEACANLGDDDAAVGYVNVLLDRARHSVDSGVAAEPHDWSVSDFATKEDLVNAIFWERCFEMHFEQHEWFDTHRMGAKWLTENIAVPKNAFLNAPEQQDFTRVVNGEEMTYNGYRSVYYGKGFQYDEDWRDVRKGLVSAYPHDELVYNSLLDVNLHDPNNGQNPEDVFWR